MNTLLGIGSLLAWTAMLMARGCGGSSSSSLVVGTSRALDEGNLTPTLDKNVNLTDVRYCYRVIAEEECNACHEGGFGWNGLSTCFRPLKSNPECAEGFVIERSESTRAFGFRSDGGRNGRNMGYYQYVINTVDPDSCRANIELSLWNNSVMDPVIAEETAVVRWVMLEGRPYAVFSSETYNNSSNNNNNPDDPVHDLWTNGVNDLWFFLLTTPTCVLPNYIDGPGVSLSSGCPRGNNYPAWDSSSIFPAVYDGYGSGVVDSSAGTGQFHCWSTLLGLGSLVAGMWISFS